MKLILLIPREIGSAINTFQKIIPIRAIDKNVK